jgi:hypothetical protein
MNIPTGVFPYIHTPVPSISVIMPTIRTHLLQNWYDSLVESCQDVPFEVVCCGPFEPPKSLMEKENFIWIKSFASPTVCAQLCALRARGTYLLHSVDDAIYLPNAVAEEYRKNFNIKGMAYREGQDYSGNTMPKGYWSCGSAYSGWPMIENHWCHCVHFMMPSLLFELFGGFDCQYDYLNHATHDLLFRLQAERYEMVMSDQDVTNCSWQPERTGDHGAIHDAQVGHDAPLFHKNWFHSRPKAHIDINNWKKYPQVWKTRFTGEEGSYENLSAR